MSPAPRPRAAFVILTRNDPITKTHLKNCLYFLFRHFNARFRYPVIILHEGDFDPAAQEEILLGVRASCRALVSFYAIDKADFEVPAFLDADKIARCIETKPVPYWRNLGYRHMCRFYTKNVWKYVQGFDYVCRLDSDSIIEEPIDHDIFQWMAEKDLVYASPILHIDCAVTLYGFKDLVSKIVADLAPTKRDVFEGMFMKQTIPLKDFRFANFRRFLTVFHDQQPPPMADSMDLHTCMNYYQNMHITKVSFWSRPEVQEAIERIDRSGLIYYARLGDAPIHTVLVGLFAEPSQVRKMNLRYSKRMQREAFPGDDNKLHVFMPDTYDKSSCITETMDDKAKAATA